MFPPMSPQPDPMQADPMQAQAPPPPSVPPVTRPAPQDKVALKKRNDEFKARAETCKQYRRKLIANWTISIDYRRGKPFPSQTDEDQVAVNLDWSMTKAKIAALFSQVPRVVLDHMPDSLPESSPWLKKYENKLNDELIGAGIEAAMDESLPDCVNAAGIGVVVVSYESITEEREVPLSSEPVDGEDPKMESIPTAVDHRYVVQRISPADLLWPVNFTGANFDNAPWLGRTGRITWAEAAQKWKLTDDDKEAILGDERPMLDKLTHDVERDKSTADEMVGFDEIFYKEYQYDPEARSYSTIHHLIFINGKTEPVLDEPWKGQKVSEQDGTIVGATKFPVRCLTLAYITDETIPPSDSAIGRPQVNEINRGRRQMIQQRERSLPIRAFDVNRVDPAIQQSLMRGTWQHMIPVQGDGSRIFTEVTRAQMPQENFMFYNIAKADLDEQWTMRKGQELSESKGDPNQNEIGFNTQAGRERAKVAAFFVGIAEVLGGLMCLYEDPSAFGEGFNPAFSRALKYSILADSTVLLDASQKLTRLNQFIDTYAKSGWINIQPVLEEIATLTGLDPSMVIKPPQPKPPVEPNISLRLTGVEDMLNPLTLAFLMKSGQAPSADLIEQAKALIQQAVVPPAAAQQQGMPGQDPNAMGAPQESPMPSPDGAGGPGTPPPGAPLPAPVEGPPPGSPSPNPPPPAVGAAHPNWTVMPKLDKRTEGGKG